MRQLLGLLAPLITGLASTMITDWIDRFKAVTATWNDKQKNAVALAVAGVLSGAGALIGQQFLPPDTAAADVLNRIDVNSVAGALVAIALKHSQQIKTLRSGSAPGAAP